MRSFFFFFPLLLAVACSPVAKEPEQQTAAAKPGEPPAPGTVVAEAQTTHSEDGLNQFKFRVTISKAPEKGVYTVRAEDGPTEGETQFTLPKGAENYRVVMREGDRKNRMIIGFKAPGDTAFYPYYEVVAEAKTIRAQYTNAYRFE